jgi:hypothetical protein
MRNIKIQQAYNLGREAWAEGKPISVCDQLCGTDDTRQAFVEGWLDEEFYTPKSYE